MRRGAMRHTVAGLGKPIGPPIRCTSAPDRLVSRQRWPGGVGRDSISAVKDDSSTAEVSAAADASDAWFVYIVECADRSLYAGVAKNAEARVAKHNDGSGAKYTRTRRPVELVYLEPARDRGAALKREHEIKRMSAGEKRQLVEQQP